MSKRKILIGDNSLSMRRLMEHSLRQCGFQNIEVDEANKLKWTLEPYLEG